MNVNDENKKLESVVKSCKAARICSLVIFALFAAANVLTLITGIVLVLNQDKFDEQFSVGFNETNINQKLSIGPYGIMTIDDGDIKMADSAELESSIPAVQNFFDEHKDSFSLVIGVYLIGIGIICFVMAFSMWLISSVFGIIVKEGNPFADKVPKRLLTAMIIVAVLVAVTTGFGFAILIGFVAWALYTILEYGRVLRIQSDETL